MIPEFVNDSNIWKNIINGLSSLSVVLHEHGINIRHMGLIRSLHCQMCKEKEYYDQIQKILLFEIVARTLKQMFRMCLRTTALRAKSASDVPFKNCSTQFLNLICSQENESLFWSETLPSQVFKRFGSCSLRSEERAELRYQFSLNRLIHRLTRDCGITLDLKCVEEMIGHSFEFTRGDIESVEPKFRAMFTTQHVRGVSQENL